MRLQEAMNSNLTVQDTKAGAAIIPALSDLVNSFGNHDKEVTEAVMQNDAAKKNFLMVASACMVALGYTRKCEDMRRGHWDDRNAASSKYCKEHLSEFLEMFEAVAGFPIRFKDRPEYQYFQHDTLFGRLGTKNMQIVSETEAFLRDHPTLQQKMVGVFLRTIADNNLYPGIDPEGFTFI